MRTYRRVWGSILRNRYLLFWWLWRFLEGQPKTELDGPGQVRLRGDGSEG